MKSLILAAGYATRLYPLTQNFPKPLLMVQNRTILDWLLDDLATTDAIDEYAVITNHRYAIHFQEWIKNRPEKITVIDDGTVDNDHRLGAVKDLQLAMDILDWHDDLLVMAGDNLLDFSLKSYVEYFRKKNTSCIMRYYEPSMQKLLKMGVISVDDNDIILNMTEKSPTPATHWCCPPFYFFKNQDIRLVQRAIESGCGIDAPGSFIAWLCHQVPIHAMEMPGNRYDIGTLESYEEVKAKFQEINPNP